MTQDLSYADRLNKMLSEGYLQALSQRFDTAHVQAVVLVGSHARGDAGPYSDIDLVRLYGEQAPAKSSSHLIDGYLVVVSNVTLSKTKGWFTQPEVTVNVLAGIRQARILIDRNNAFSTLQERARAFTWNKTMQERANRWASEQLVGWAEEVHKGLEGLQRSDIGRLLNARFGLSWGLSRVVQTQRGILISGDNAFYDEVAQVVGIGTPWVRLRHVAFGLDGEPLQAQVIAGLQLYLETVRLLESTLQPAHLPLIRQVTRHIEQAL